MADRLFDLMDWAEIEAVVYAEEDQPGKFLGPKITPYGVLIQTFIPGTSGVSVRTAEDNALHPMVMEDEEGFFAVLLKRRDIPEYVFEFRDSVSGELRTVKDPYAFPALITKKEETRSVAGIWYDSYRKLGAHKTKINGTEGVHFAVWAPNAMRVSVVGDFDHWDGRVCQMNRRSSGIFELFVPGLEEGALYKYEIKTQSGQVYLKADPYGMFFESGGDGASKVAAEDTYTWNDGSWMEERDGKQNADRPFFVYQLHLNAWRKDDGGTYGNYRQIADDLAAYISGMGYTHVELLPVMEYPDDSTYGFETEGYFAPTARYGTPDDMKYFVDCMHQHGIGVILDYVASYFAKGDSLLAGFDGTCLYEHLDPRRGIHPLFGTHIFNYGRPEVCNFLISGMLFWAEQYHADGFKLNDVSTMLYQDYNREDGQWVANLYGGSENLEAIDFLKNMNREVHRVFPGILTIAEEQAAFPHVTGGPEENGLGFDLKWNNGWAHDYLDYIHFDPVFRGAHQEELTFSTVYAYSEKFILGFSKDDVMSGRGTGYAQMPGEDPNLKLANLRLSFGYMLAHPGKKLLFMGEDTAEDQEWTGERIRTEDLAPEQEAFHQYVKALLTLYREQPALWRSDRSAEGFEWISNLDWQRNLLIFLRKTEDAEETLLIVCNFSNREYDKFRIGVPYAGKYKEIFNSDAASFGGTGAVNPRVKMSRQIEHDERPDSIEVIVPPLGVSVFRYSKAEKKRTTNRAAKTAAHRGKSSGQNDLKDTLQKAFREKK